MSPSVGMGIVLLCALGLAVSAAMTRAFYRSFAQRRAESSQHIDAGACLSVLETPQARIFGVPNSWLGILFYLFVPGALALWPVTGAEGWLWAAFCAAAAALALSAYLAYALLFRLRMSCRLCRTGHGINLTLAPLLGLALSLSKGFCW